MSVEPVEPDVWEQRRVEFPLLADAVDRHLAWARDFTDEGDLDSALDALEDARSVATELLG
jgi:hypothetical protein